MTGIQFPFFQIETAMTVKTGTVELSVMRGSMLIGRLLQDVVTITVVNSDEGKEHGIICTQIQRSIVCLFLGFVFLFGVCVRLENFEI